MKIRWKDLDGGSLSRKYTLAQNTTSSQKVQTFCRFCPRQEANVVKCRDWWVANMNLKQVHRAASDLICMLQLADSVI